MREIERGLSLFRCEELSDGLTAPTSRVGSWEPAKFHTVLCRCVEHAPLWAPWFLFLNKLLSQKKKQEHFSLSSNVKGSATPSVQRQREHTRARAREAKESDQSIRPDTSSTHIA